uniref:Cell division protein n=1 Tax=Macrostomum lignano TaxID=282301 RepID=A0A1I8I9E2_9PLAT
MRIMLLKAQAKYFRGSARQYFNQTGDLRISHTREAPFFEHMHISPCIAPVSRLVDKLTLPGLIMSGIFILVLL